MKTKNAVSKNNMLTHHLAEPLNDAKAVTLKIDAADGNLTIDRNSIGEGLLISGELEYFEKQGVPTRSLEYHNGTTTLTVKGGQSGRPWLRMPWSTCNGAHEWRIHLNSGIALDIDAHSGGGNVRLDLSDTVISNLSADTGGGNVEIILPESAADLVVFAKSGAGNVDIRIPKDSEARIKASSGLGKVTLDPSFSKVDKDTYQSSCYETASHKIEISASTGAGNVSVSNL